MTVRSMHIDRRAPFEGGARFGDGGGYELLEGRASIALDPRDPVNAAVPDLALTAAGRIGPVEVEADVVILRPVDPAAANGGLLVVVPNRGNPGDFPCAVLPADVRDAPWHPGDGFLLKRGWTIAWVGWQADVVRGSGLLGCTVPQALEDDGAPISGARTLEFTVDGPSESQSLGAYPAAVGGDADLVQARPGEGWQSLPSNRWRIAGASRGAPGDTSVWLNDGFQAGFIYRLHYRTRACPVIGAGLLAFRETVAFLRHASVADGNPIGDIPRSATLGWGVSQSGRFLRELVFSGGNSDELGRPAFDVVLPFVAGARRGEFVVRHGEPGHLWVEGACTAGPYAAGGPDGLLASARRAGNAPRMVITNSAAEYWRGDAALGHITPDGSADLPDDPDVRNYLVAGADHVSGRATIADGQTAPPNTLDPTRVWRAILQASFDWVAKGIEPPASRVPRVADGSAVPRESVLARFAEAGLPAEAVTPERPWPRSALVSAVGEHLDEVAGIRLPAQGDHRRVYTGWSDPRALGMAAVAWRMLGCEYAVAGMAPASSTVLQAANALVRDRLLLAEDVDAEISSWP